MNLPAASSSSKYLLYSHYRALDLVQEQDLIPLRLFRVLYPLWRVRLEGRQQVATEFDELEWYLERALQETGFVTMDELSVFFGLELPFVERLIAFLRRIGHLDGDNTHLRLTALGTASVRDRIRYEDQKVTTELYFDGLGNNLLTPEHFKIPILETLPEKTPFQAFYHFDHTWQPEVLTRLMESPDKQRFNLPDEVSSAQLLNTQPVYMPAYFVEARGKDPASPPRLLVFSQVRGLHDTVLEQAVNRDPTVFRALKARSDSRPEAVRRYFEQSGLKKDAWYLNEEGQWGAQVMVDGQVFLPSNAADEDEASRLTLRSVGRYSLIYDWCIWVVCDDINIRKQAAAEQLLEWLQNANAKPPAEEVRRKKASLYQRLSLPPQPVQDLLGLARRRGYARAAERLEEMDDPE